MNKQHGQSKSHCASYFSSTREIDAASRTGNLAGQAATAHKLNGIRATALPPPPRWSRRARLVTGYAVVTCLGGSRCNSVARSRK